MARKCLTLGKYTREGLAGAVKDGLQSRYEAIDTAIRSLGGRSIEYSWVQGEYDFIILAELDEESTTQTLQMAAGVSGTVTSHTIRLLSAQEMDASRAHIASLKFKPAGQ